MTRQPTRFTKRKVRIAVAISTIVVGAGAVVIYSVWRNQPIIDQRLIREADFPVYVPRSLPEGFVVQREHTQLDTGVLSYVVASETTGREVTVTVQPKPAKFDMSQMTKGGSIESVAVTTGILYNLSAVGTSRYLLDTGDTLVFLTSPSSIDMATMTSLTNSLDRFN